MPGPHARRGFTLIEMLVVIAIIVILVGILLPALSAARIRAQKVASQAQLTNISTACETYYTTFGAYPGYVADSSLSGDTTVSTTTTLTGTENLVLSLMGQTTTNTGKWKVPGSSPQAYVDNVATSSTYAIGSGPVTTAGKSYDAFYSPKADELGNATVGGKTTNIPDILDAGSKVPILYYRSNPSALSTAVPVATTATTGSRIYMAANAAYYSATSLQGTGSSYAESTNSLLADSTNGPNALAAFIINQTLSNVTSTTTAANANKATCVLRGAYVLFSPGPDGIYINKWQNVDSTGKPVTAISALSQLSSYDDVVVTGGSN